MSHNLEESAGRRLTEAKIAARRAGEELWRRLRDLNTSIADWSAYGNATVVSFEDPVVEAAWRRYLIPADPFADVLPPRMEHEDAIVESHVGA